MPVVEVNHTHTHIQYLRNDSPETIVMIHGMFSNLSVYYFNIAPELSKDANVLLYDLKSHGLSQRFENGYTLDAMSDDLVQLLDAMELDSVHLVGYSFGALVALKAALTHPERVKKMALIEAPDPSDEVDNIIGQYSKEYLANYIRNFTKATHLKPGKRQFEKNHQMYEYLFNKTSLKRDMHQDRDLFECGRLSALTNQTLLLYGEHSECRQSGVLLNGLIPASELLVGEGDHNLPVQNPEWVAEKLKSFLTSPPCPFCL